MAKTLTQADPKYQWAVPAQLGMPSDTLRLRLDFFTQACQMTIYEDNKVTTRTVDALDVAHALAGELSFSTGLLPRDTLWWMNTKRGPVTAVYDPPQIRKVALQVSAAKHPARYLLPLPGFIFLCTPGREPWVYATKRRPAAQDDEVFKAPLLNVFANGRTCPGTQKYAREANETIKLFWISFFTHAADMSSRSKRFPKDITDLWKSLDRKSEFPVEDLVKHGTILDLMRQVIS